VKRRRGRWGVVFNHTHDERGTNSQWIQYFHTKIGARFAMFVSSRFVGSGAELFDSRKDPNAE
jgi:hypothetical protein